MDAANGMSIPEGGLASFLTSNIDEMDDSRLAFGSQSGINSMRDTAERMAQMGRGGDNFVVHASEREMMVPREVVENNPELRAAIMRGIAAEGADPNAYIVGSDANSINPFTGQREFFFKKIARAVKKIVKGVVNVIKKVAPIVLPIIGSMILGPIVGSALGSAAATAINGGSAKDILKSAATAVFQAVFLRGPRAPSKVCSQALARSRARKPRLARQSLQAMCSAASVRGSRNAASSARIRAQTLQLWRQSAVSVAKRRSWTA